MPEQGSGADFLELFAGEARLSQAFAKRRKKVLQPYDLRFGHDLRSTSMQAEVLEIVSRERPKLIWAAPPCTEWCAFSRLNHSPQERRRRRAKEVVFLKFLSEVLDRQRAHGGHLAVENPRSSDMWRHPEIDHWLRVPGSSFAEVDLCQYGLVSVVNGAPLRKGLSIFTTSPGLAGAIATRCPGDHEHRPVQADTGRSANYPARFANAVAKVFWHGLLFDGMHHEHRYGVQHAYVTGNQAEEECRADEGSTGAPSITFKGKVNPTIAAVLRRVHQNLGHPPNKELIRHLRIAGATPAIVQAAEQLTCRTCDRSTMAKLPRVAKPVTALDFNEVVAIDVIWLEASGSNGADIPALNVVDTASSYQVVIPLPSTKSEDAGRTFMNGWVQWAGAPRFVLADLDSAFKDRFLEVMDQQGIAVRCAAGQAHWQNSVAERQGETWKAIWDKHVDANNIVKEEAVEAIAAINAAKNSLRTRAGYSPRHWVFGCNQRLPGDPFDAPEEEGIRDLATADAKFARKQVIRLGARTAFCEIQASESLKRAAAHKPRVEGLPFEPGALVYVHRQVRPGKGKRPTTAWIGPATVLGREGSNYWVARGGRCLLAAAEHVRSAHHEEVNEFLRIRMALQEVRDLVSNQDGLQAAEVEDVAEFVDGWDDGDQPGPTARTDMELEAEEEPDERPLYVEAELKQWQEHVDFGAVKALSVEDSHRVLREVDPSRILSSRFAYN